MSRNDHLRLERTLGAAAIAVAALTGPLAAAALLDRGHCARERRERTVALLREFLDEPMASTRRAAWAFLQAEGDEVRHFSHYYLTDPAYGEFETRGGIAAVLRVLLFQRSVQGLREAGALDERLDSALLEPHRRAWTGYTALMAEQSATHPDAIARGDSGLFQWRMD